MSRLTQAKEAVRPALKGRMMIAGPAGSGKTRTGLMIGETLAEGGPILVIDTEKESALTYADDFRFKHLAWEPPFDPRELTATVLDAGGTYAVVIIDSATHFWQANGGTLDIANGKFTGWKEARPAQEDLVQAILSTEAHVIVCVRSKMKHEQVEENGRHKVHKLGMGPVQDADLEYEMNVSLSVDMGHTLAVAKSRTMALPVGREFKPGHATDLAELYRDWLKGGEPPAARAVIDGLVERLNALPEAARVAAKQEFVATLCRPDHLTEAQVPDAEALVARHEAAAPPRPPDDGGPGGNGQDSGGATDREAVDSTATPAGVDQGEYDTPPEPAIAGNGTAGGGGESPAAGQPNPEGQTPPHGINVRDVARKAALVFKADSDAAPRGKKTKVVDRYRHALVYACTQETAASLNDLTPEQLAKVWQRLEDIAAGRITHHGDPLDAAAGVTFTSQSGKETTVLWADAEMAAAHTEAAA